MPIRVGWIKPRAAQVAEVRVAARADHVVAPVSLLRWSIARGAGARVQVDVLQRSLLLLRELAVAVLGAADDELAVPRLEAAAAEREVAVLADGQEVGAVELLLVRALGFGALLARTGITVLGLRFVELKTLGLFVLL
jgi:hypothetical protein